MSKTVTYTLVHPITVTMRGPQGDRAETISQVEIRRAKGSDFRALIGVHDKMAAGIRMVERLTSLEPMIVDELDGADFDAISEIIEGFTPPGPQTGNGSSAS